MWFVGPDQLARSIAQIQSRCRENVVAVFGTGAVAESLRLRHLHITVDDLPRHWADASDNTNRRCTPTLATPAHLLTLTLVIL
ncbi:DUF6130 family protein [Cupriavidus sp. 2TAF22]|uniref:DUF6130 family protein n=1 Tax=unclassified Cupriavidus TaxID=2640874 RepID=UPI003F8F5EB1